MIHSVFLIQFAICGQVLPFTAGYFNARAIFEHEYFMRGGLSEERYPIQIFDESLPYQLGNGKYEAAVDSRGPLDYSVSERIPDRRFIGNHLARASADFSGLRAQAALQVFPSSFGGYGKLRSRAEFHLPFQLSSENPYLIPNHLLVSYSVHAKFSLDGSGAEYQNASVILDNIDRYENGSLIFGLKDTVILGTTLGRDGVGSFFQLDKYGVVKDLEIVTDGSGIVTEIFATVQDAEYVYFFDDISDDIPPRATGSLGLGLTAEAYVDRFNADPGAIVDSDAFNTVTISSITLPDGTSLADAGITLNYIGVPELGSFGYAMVCALGLLGGALLNILKSRTGSRGNHHCSISI